MKVHLHYGGGEYWFIKEEPQKHATHGRESAEETPNMTHCPCCRPGNEQEMFSCAKAGCGYCSLIV